MEEQKQAQMTPAERQADMLAQAQAMMLQAVADKNRKPFDMPGFQAQKKAGFP